MQQAYLLTNYVLFLFNTVFATSFNSNDILYYIQFRVCFCLIIDYCYLVLSQSSCLGCFSSVIHRIVQNDTYATHRSKQLNTSSRDSGSHRDIRFVCHFSRVLQRKHQCDLAKDTEALAKMHSQQHSRGLTWHLFAGKAPQSPCTI